MNEISLASFMKAAQAKNPPAPEWCCECGSTVQIQIFKGTGCCSVLCLKQHVANQQVIDHE